VAATGSDASECCRQEYCAEWNVRQNCSEGTAIITAAETAMGSSGTVCCDVVPPPDTAPRPIPQVEVDVVIEEYSPDEAAAAGVELAAALSAATAVGATVEMVQIQSSVTFPLLDPIPPDFADKFKLEMAGTIGGGGVFQSHQIFVSEDFSGGRRQLQDDTMDVDFSINAPSNAANTTASLLVAAASEPLNITVGNITVSGQVSAEPPVVQTYSDCIGAWTPCGQTCIAIFGITQVATGNGQECDAEHLAEQVCDGDFCPPDVEDGYYLLHPVTCTGIDVADMNVCPDECVYTPSAQGVPGNCGEDVPFRSEL